MIIIFDQSSSEQKFYSILFSTVSNSGYFLLFYLPKTPNPKSKVTISSLREWMSMQKHDCYCYSCFCMYFPPYVTYLIKLGSLWFVQKWVAR